MNKIQKILTKVLTGIDVSGIDVKKATDPGVRYQFMNGTLTMITDNSDNYIKKGYTVNDIVYSIVKLITDKVKIAPWNLYTITDESSLKSKNSLQRKGELSSDDVRQIKALSKKALDIFKGSNNITNLLRYPNDYCTFQDFVSEMAGYKLLTGNSYTWMETADMGADNGKPVKLYQMPSQYVQIIGIAGFPGGVEGYKLSVLGGTGYPKEQVLHVKEPNYRWSVNGEQWYGMSPLKAALSVLTRNNSALESTTARFQNQGADGILYVKGDQIRDRKDALEQANAVKAKWITEYSGEVNAGKIGTSGYELGFVPIGMSPADLKILEVEKWDMRRFCNVFGVPSQLMNDPDNKSFNNIKESEKALTSRCALPQLISIRDGLNRWFWDYGEMPKNMMIDFDMTVFSELQESVGDSMKWLQPLMDKGLPLNYALDTLGMEKVDPKEFDEPWVTAGMGVPFSEWQMGAVNDALGGSLDENDI